MSRIFVEIHNAFALFFSKALVMDKPIPLELPVTIIFLLDSM